MEGFAPPGTKPPKTGVKAPKSTSPEWKSFTAARWHKNHPGAGAGGGNGGVGAAPARTVATAPPESPLMSLFHSTLSEMKSLSPEVDATAIRAPYEAAKVTTGQLGEGFRQQMATGGQVAQDQYAKAQTEAQQHAAQAGITSGAGANPTALADNTTGLLAQQTQANQAAASAAATAWQGLLDRTGATAVSKAQQQRQNNLDTAGLSLAASLPTLDANAKQLDFNKKNAADTNAYLYASLNQKGKDSLRQFILDQAKAGATQDYQQGLLDQGQQTIDLRKSQNAATITHWDQQIAATNRKISNAEATAGSKFVGLPQILSTLKGPGAKTTKGAKVQQGYKVTYQPQDSAGFYGSPHEVIVDDPNWKPGKGNGVVTVNKNMVPSTDVTTSAGSFSWARWKAAYKMAKTLNPTWSDAAIRGILPATPSTKKKPGPGH